MTQLYTLLYIVRYTPLILTVATGSSADKIGPTGEDSNITVKETDSVSLKCSYESKSSSIWLYWYIQYPHSAPEFLLVKGARLYSSHGRNPTDTRLQAKATSDSTELSIRGLKFSDSALYHCALKESTQ
ncbi:hypothetical protein C0J50_10473 [Silurus asotus]|uniref:Ig-like domain-containing protein n=1 Tax=Silurus asotus TaxID=30991 RepID=A0AAD5FUL2_SILAS|nr:hypothetical protein C0J50_10473 [Silurus asotus]